MAKMWLRNIWEESLRWWCEDDPVGKKDEEEQEVEVEEGSPAWL